MTINRISILGLGFLGLMFGIAALRPSSIQSSVRSTPIQYAAKQAATSMPVTVSSPQLAVSIPAAVVHKKSRFPAADRVASAFKGSPSVGLPQGGSLSNDAAQVASPPVPASSGPASRLADPAGLVRPEPASIPVQVPVPGPEKREIAVAESDAPGLRLTGQVALSHQDAASAEVPATFSSPVNTARPALPEPGKFSTSSRPFSGAAREYSLNRGLNPVVDVEQLDQALALRATEIRSASLDVATGSASDDPDVSAPISEDLDAASGLSHPLSTSASPPQFQSPR
jgi:hypothetical protein